jgi:proteasome lid subunit RPN8/RPN11
MIDEYNTALLLSVAYLAPYVNANSITMLAKDEVFKLVEMYDDEALRYVKINNMKTVPLESILEEAYVLCNETLINVGLYEGGYIPSESLLKYRSICNRMVGLHTHPIPLPIPTPEDLISMKQIGYNIECVLSRIDESKAKMICIEPLDDFRNVLNSMLIFSKVIYSLVDRYIVVEDELGVQFLPYPTNKSLQRIEEELVSLMKRKCRLNIVSLDMKKNEYDVIAVL